MKANKKIIYLIILFFLYLLIFTTKAQAASVSLNPSKTTVTVGDEFNISANLAGASVATLTTRISVDTSKVEYISGPANTNFSNGKVIYTWTDPTGGENPKTEGTIATFRFKAKATGTAGFSVSGNFYTPDETAVNPSFSGTSITIKEKETTPETSNPTPMPTPTPPTTGGSGTTGGSTSGGTNAGGSTNQGGSSSSGNTTTQTASSNANLKELHLSVEGLSPAFQKNVTRYNLIVGNDISQISIYAIPEETNAKVSVTGNTNLQIGTNQVRITVTAPDKKTSKIYTIEVTKTENPDLANANLEILAIENVTLEPEFNPDITMYNAIIGSEIENINILAIPQIEGANVTIIGNDNIQFGYNTITINVIAKDGVTNKEYIISLYKTTEEEENKDIMLINEEENIQEVVDNKITAGDIFFTIIIAGSTIGAIYLLIRKYRMEN